MDYKTKLIANEFIENDIESIALYSDAKLLLALLERKDLTSVELLKLMQVQRAQRYRRLKRLKTLGLIEQRADPNVDRFQRRRMLTHLTDKGKRVAKLIQKSDRFRDFKCRIPDKLIQPKKRPKVIPPRVSIYDSLEDNNTEDLLDEEEETEWVEDLEDEEFEMESFLDELRKETKDD